MTTLRRPLVSVLTGTWQRPQLLAELKDHLQLQTYRNFEHVIVHDGPEPAAEGEEVVPEHIDWPHNEAWRRALLRATGEYSIYWPADDRVQPDYLARLVDAAVKSRADFVYPSLLMRFPEGRPEGQADYTIGAAPPTAGQISICLFKTRLRLISLHHRTWDGEWRQIEMWLRAGATWRFCPEIVIDHQVDHWGGWSTWPELDMPAILATPPAEASA